MTFADIPAGAAIFLDANVLVYHLTSHAHLGHAYTNLIKRIEQGSLPKPHVFSANSDPHHHPASVEG